MATQGKCDSQTWYYNAIILLRSIRTTPTGPSSSSASSMRSTIREQTILSRAGPCYHSIRTYRVQDRSRAPRRGWGTLTTAQQAHEITALSGGTPWSVGERSGLFFAIRGNVCRALSDHCPPSSPRQTTQCQEPCSFFQTSTLLTQAAAVQLIRKCDWQWERRNEAYVTGI